MNQKPDHGERIRILIGDLDAAATPTKCEVVTLCGYAADQARDALSSILAENEALRAALEDAERRLIASGDLYGARLARAALKDNTHA